jgi:signal transduction histidine kinase
VIITIEDNGPGVPDNMKEKIFQPNFSTKTSGMGLGLAISRKIIETSDGSIVCEDSQLGGAQFIVELPVVKPSNSIQ